MMFDRETYFDLVRATLFNGRLSQDQVDGQEGILTTWESFYPSDDMRWLAYALATTKHETANEMMPIAEYGQGKGQPYGVEDTETDQTYYGRGFVQLTWRENYARADRELDLTAERSCEWFADNALEPDIAGRVMFRGMMEGWFRTHEDGGPENFERYFNATTDDPYHAREIINGDTSKNGKLIEGYHDNFLEALTNSAAAYDPAEEAIGEYDHFIIRVPAGTPMQILRVLSSTATFPVTPETITKGDALAYRRDTTAKRKPPPAGWKKVTGPKP